ncbi:MAG: hypothetical protein LBK22_06185, partial [Tannerella sp.]|jgi:hypothetical protein|nr:hypothetical protein [Tannerella sp.]
VHRTRESLEYATALLKTGDPTRRRRALDIVRTVLPMQEKDPSAPWCGVWPYYPEDPLRGRRAAVDYNWADFIAVPLLDVLINHADDAGDALTADIRRALILAAEAIRRRDVQPDYTNICIMGAYVCYLVGDLCGLPDMTEYARKRLRCFHDYTLRNGGFIEYNSPTYTLVAMDELLRMKQAISRPDDRRMVDELYAMTWDLIARHFHRPSGQWCGPNLRAYGNLADPAYYRLLYNASGGRIDLPGDYPRIPDVMKPHRIPENLLQKFTQPVLPRLEIDTFVTASPPEKSIVGKLYAGRTFALASVNQGYLWNQTRPLIAHWGTPERPSYLRVRFLHDGYDFAAANIACIQDSTSVLAIFNVALDGGDTHPGLDRIRNASIDARDLRLRIEAGGDLSGAQFILPKDASGVAVFTSPAVSADIRIPYAGWDGYAGRWERLDEAETVNIDYVLYAGEERTFRLDEMQEAVAGLCLSMYGEQDGGNRRPAADVTAKIENTYLTLSNGRMTIKAPAKPDREAEIRRDYETAYKQ